VIRGAGDEPHPVVHQRSVAGDIVLVVDQPSMAVRSSRRTRFRWTLSRRSFPVRPDCVTVRCIRITAVAPPGDAISAPARAPVV
jgi:hypothetical protein